MKPLQWYLDPSVRWCSCVPDEDGLITVSPQCPRHAEEFYGPGREAEGSAGREAEGSAA